jgi:hypothetical protein
MTPIPLLPGFVGVKVPEGANGFQISDHVDLVFYEGKPSFKSIIDIQLPPGDYSFLFVTNGITEEQARKIVDYDDEWNCYTDYTVPVTSKVCCDTALESFQSLMKSNSMEGNWAILKIKQ